MKIYKYILILISVLFLFACEKETEGVSRITYYVDLELKGNPIEFVSIGGTYNEPGWTAFEGDIDVSENVKVSGKVEVNTLGYYTLNYSVNNADGFPKTASRSVIVYDPAINTDISGEYVTVEGTYRYRAGAIIKYPGFNVTITKVAPGTFAISDFLGGYYAQRAGYGSAYAGSGYVQLNSNNKISLIYSFVPGWGDALSALKNAEYNPGDGSIKWAADYAGMTFNVVLN